MTADAAFVTGWINHLVVSLAVCAVSSIVELLCRRGTARKSSSIRSTTKCICGATLTGTFTRFQPHTKTFGPRLVDSWLTCSSYHSCPCSDCDVRVCDQSRPAGRSHFRSRHLVSAQLSSLGLTTSHSSHSPGVGAICGILRATTAAPPTRT